MRALILVIAAGCASDPEPGVPCTDFHGDGYVGTNRYITLDLSAVEWVPAFDGEPFLLDASICFDLLAREVDCVALSTTEVSENWYRTGGAFWNGENGKAAMVAVIPNANRCEWVKAQ
jgi:hypothetical protein